jgi:hypothetical protein
MKTNTIILISVAVIVVGVIIYFATRNTKQTGSKTTIIKGPTQGIGKEIVNVGAGVLTGGASTAASGLGGIFDFLKK